MCANIQISNCNSIEAVEINGAEASPTEPTAAEEAIYLQGIRTWTLLEKRT